MDSRRSRSPRRPLIRPQYVRFQGVGLESAAVPRLSLQPDEQLHVLVPTVAVGDAVEALSTRVRAHLVDPDDGAPSGAASGAQVWVPRNGSPGVPDNGFLEGLSRLQLVQLQSAGAERFLGRLPEGVVLCNARGAHTPSTAEWVLTAILASQRGIPFFVREQDAGRWSSATHGTLFGARVLIVGAGDIGRTVGRMLSPFDVELTYVARTARDGVHSVAELPGLLPAADVVVLLVPVTAETIGLVDAAFLAAMKDDALLVNAARGVVVDTGALLGELTSGRLRAAVDVTDPEPLPAGSPLWSAPGLLLTPHVGGNVPQTDARAAAAVTAQLARVLAGEPLLDVVDEY
jgi:phosphoglycerate dehydrogenase-like enzyme